MRAPVPELGNGSGPKPHHSAPGRMVSFTDTLGRLAAECVHKKRKASCEGHAEEVRAALAKQWEKVDKEACQELARKHAEGMYKMKYKCTYEIHEKELLLLLPEELQEDVQMKQIDCHRCEGGYSIEFYFGHKRDRFLEELEKQDPSPYAKKQHVEDETKEEKKEPSSEGKTRLTEELEGEPRSKATQRLQEVSTPETPELLAELLRKYGVPVERFGQGPDGGSLQELHRELQEGEGAFYGPKVEFVLKDCLDREWQCGTIQADFSMPDRLDAHYIAEDGSKQIPVMLHRVIVGSIERFTGILIEHYEGAFPSWLAPIQAVIINISQKQEEYTKNVEINLKNQGLRVISDLRNEKIGFKIREHSMQRYPYILVVGDREQENNQVSVRRRGGEDLGSMSLEALTELINQE
mgnify:CR=1 FL=1